MIDGPTFSIVTTTINVPLLLDAYVDDALAHDRHLASVYVVGDLKTAADAAAHCRALADRSGVDVRYVTPDEQSAYLARWPALRDFLPWNSIQRRNVGMLMAYEQQVDVVVTIDDDNYLEQPDYLGAHAHLGQTRELDAVASPDGWWNVCEMLEEARGIPFYHRGYPLSRRWADATPERLRLTARPVVNAGLWLGDPDVDALARLYWPVEATRVDPAFPDCLALAPRTWSPFDSQNTAMLREVVPSYVLLPRIGRYDDIWASYIVRRIADEIGDVVTYGAPLVRQERNAHDYFKDFDDERFGLQQNDTFIEALASCRLTPGNYQSMFADVAGQLRELLPESPFATVIEGSQIWADVFTDIGA